MRYIIFIVATVLTFLETMTIKDVFELNMLVLFILWLLVLKLFKPTDLLLDYIGVSLFGLMFIFFMLDSKIVAEKFAIYVVLLLVIKADRSYKNYLKGEVH